MARQRVCSPNTGVRNRKTHWIEPCIPWSFHSAPKTLELHRQFHRLSASCTKIWYHAPYNTSRPTRPLVQTSESGSASSNKKSVVLKGLSDLAGRCRANDDIYFATFKQDFTIKTEAESFARMPGRCLCLLEWVPWERAVTKSDCIFVTFRKGNGCWWISFCLLALQEFSLT